MNRIYFILLFFCLTANLSAQNGHRIEIGIEGYEEKSLMLGFYYGDKTLLKDTAYVNDQGTYVFEGEEALDPGMYLVVLQPDNNYFQLLIDQTEQFFKVQTKKAELTKNLEFENAPENELFYSYLKYLGDARPASEKLQKAYAEAKDKAEKQKIEGQINQLNQKVQDFQSDLVAKHPKSFTALIINSNKPVPSPPAFEGAEEEVQRKNWYFHRQHYFDHIDVADQRLIRTPFFFEKINTYIEKLHFQTPDSLKNAMDDLLDKIEPSPETYKFFLIHYLNKYASSKVVGMDAVYVHLALNYYGKGKADWVEQEQLGKILKDAKKLEPLLIGKKAPNIKSQRQDGTKVEMYDVNAEYTIVYFWRYDCGHCKKSTPFMRDFYNKYKDQGVKIYSICTKQGKEIPGCWDYIKENEVEDWMHTVDPYGLYMLDYDVKTTPQMYILNKDKEIIMKKIGAEQLEEVMDKIIEMNKKEKEAEGDDR